MRNDRVQKLHETLRITSAKAASYVGIAPSGIGFLRNGKRSPSRVSATTEKYVRGMVRLVTDTGQQAALIRLICSSAYKTDSPASAKGNDVSEEALKETLTDWLFEGEAEQRLKDAETEAGFACRLDAVMTLLGMTNSALCKETGADAASVSRLRRGLSSPYSSPALVRKITHALSEAAERENRLGALEKLTGLPVPANGRDRFTEALLYRWFFGRAKEHSATVGHILSRIAAPETKEGLTRKKEAGRQSGATVAETVTALAGNAVCDTDTYYTGNHGLRRAVLRFLSGSLLRNRKKLLLYSDQPMGWLTENASFLKKWSALMSLCLANGVKITIIHSLTRGMEELTEAVAGWLPLYMSGGITPYYRNARKDFSGCHTLFLSPGFACIHAYLPDGQTENGIYRFDTDKRLLSSHRKTFDDMLSSAERLLEVVPGIPDMLSPQAFVSDPDIPDVGVCVFDDCACVVKQSPPAMTFRFLHPVMREALSAYAAGNR